MEDSFDDAADEFPFDDCSDTFSDAESGESNADVITLRSSDNENFPAGSLRRRRSIKYDDSGKFTPSPSFKSYLNSRERKLRFTRKTSESFDNVENSSSEAQKGYNSDNDEENKSNVDNLNSIKLDLRSETQKCNNNEENENNLKILNTESVMIGSSNSVEEDSIITNVNGDGIDSLEAVDSHLSENDDLTSNILFDLVNLMMKAVGFQMNMLIWFVNLTMKFLTFPVWLIYSWYMFVMDPFQLMRRGKRYVVRKFMRSFGFLFEKVFNFVSEWLKEHSSWWRLGLKFGWGCLWSVYVCCVLVGLFVFAFILSGILVRMIVHEPIKIDEIMHFDYTVKSPVAYVPIIRSPGVTCGVESESQLEVGMVDGMRLIPPNHKLQVTISLTLPESDYNRHLGIFQVRVDFLTATGKVLASSRRPCMLQFRSYPIRLLSTFLKAVPLVTGYTSESQKLKVELKGFTEGFIPTACLRVIIEQRAEFQQGGGIPEMYAASLTLESELPFLKRMLWYWKTTLFVWVSLTLFTVEFLFALLCCKPLIIPRLRLRHGSNSHTGSENNPPVER